MCARPSCNTAESFELIEHAREREMKITIRVSVGCSERASDLSRVCLGGARGGIVRDGKDCLTKTALFFEDE